MILTDNVIVERIDKRRVLTTLGYSRDARIPNRIISLVDEYTREFYHLIDPTYSYVVRDINSVHGEFVTIEGGGILSSKILACLLEQCDKLALFTLTIGNNLENIIAALARDGDILKATVLDAIASNAVEQTAEFVQTQVRERARLIGLFTSRRFSPGYCDWNISQQEMVFGAMGDNTCGVSLTDGYLMVPRKSISGIIGLGSSDRNIEEYNPCVMCQKRSCQDRRI